MSSQRDELDFDYGGDMQQAWEGGLGNLSGAGAAFQEKMLQFDADGLPLLDPYVFGEVVATALCFSCLFELPIAEPENKYLGPTTSPRSYLNDAKALLEQNGSLSEAALLLEAAIQKGEMGEGGYESWIMLGETRNMDEREEAGMRALTQGVKIAEAAGTSGAGMIVRQSFLSKCDIYLTCSAVPGHLVYERIIRQSIPHDAPPLAARPVPIAARPRRDHPSTQN